MTRLLTKAFEEASKLPQAMQDQLGHQILEDLAGELQPDQTLARSQDQLDRTADEAREAWKLVEAGGASWDGGKPRGSANPPKVRGKTAAEMVVEDRR